MKFLVLDASGMKGHVVALCLRDNGHKVDAYAEERVLDFDTVIGTYQNTQLLQKSILEGDYDAVINLYGVVNQFADEDKAKAVYINSYLPHLLVNITENRKTKVIQISTDCIYSGLTGSYTEEDIADGTSFYARSKAIGEIKDNKNITLRNSIIGPDMNSKGIGLLNWFMQQNGTVKGFSKANWSGITSIQLAKIIEAAVSQNVHGIFNMCHKKAIDKCNLLLLFNKYFMKDSLNVICDDKFETNKSLLRTNFELDYIVPDYNTMVKEMADWVSLHKELYPHYNL